MNEQHHAKGHQALSSIKAQLLLERRYNAYAIPAVDGAGVYPFFLTAPEALTGIRAVRPNPSRHDKSSLKAHNHFSHPHSGFSSGIAFRC
jgi:hypothetical protein